jgi:hypothetical protein
MRCISVVRSLYFRILSAFLSITFLSPHIAPSTNTHVPFSLSQIIMSGLLLLGTVLSVCTVGSTIWLPCLLDLFLLILPHVRTDVYYYYNYIPTYAQLSSVNLY